VRNFTENLAPRQFMPAEQILTARSPVVYNLQTSPSVFFWFKNFVRRFINDTVSLTFEEQYKEAEIACTKVYSDVSIDRIKKIIRNLLKSRKINHNEGQQQQQQQSVASSNHSLRNISSKLVILNLDLT